MSTPDLAPASTPEPQTLVTRSLLSDVTDHSDETGSHLRRVCAMTMKLGHALNLKRPQLDDLRFSALLHDLGKGYIPLDILHKAAALDDLEFTIMRSHCEIGAFLARKNGFTPEICSVILHHHERFDGTGYPHKLIGESIPLGARIISVVDAVDTIIHERAYQHARPYEEAQSELVRCSGNQFDPRVAHVYSQLLSELADRHGWAEQNERSVALSG